MMLALTLVLFASCKKHTINRIEKDLTEGEWMITVYSEGDNVLTDKGYSEYTFQFSEDGKVDATIKTLSVCVNGTWSVYKQDKEVVVELNMMNPLNSLSEKWEVADRRRDNIDLRATSVKNVVKRVVFQRKK